MGVDEITLSSLRHRLENLAGLRDRAARSRLIAELVAEYSQPTSPGPTPLERDLFSSIVLLVFDELDRQVRFDLVVRLAKTDRIGSDLAARLAREEIELSEPVLQHSPMLSEAALLEVIRTCGPEHRLAIARRTSLSERICDAMIANGSEAVLLALLANASAALSARATLALLIFANTTENVLSALAQRALLDASFHGTLQAALDAGCPLFPEPLSIALKTDDLSALAQDGDFCHLKAQINHGGPRYSHHEAVMELENCGLSFDGLLFELVKQNRLEAASWLLARQLNLNRATVQKMLTSNADGAVMKLMLESDVSAKTYRAFLEAKWPDTKRSPRTIANLMSRYHAGRRKPRIVYI